MGFPTSVIPGLFKRNKKMKVAEAEFKDPGRKTSAEMAAERWKNVDAYVKDLIILGLEVAIKDIAQAKFTEEPKKLEGLIAARDLLWSNK